MRAVVVLTGLGLLLGGTVLAKSDAKTEVDIDQIGAELTFFSTPSGNYIALAQASDRNHVFYGTSTDLYEQRVLISATDDDDDDLSVVIWAPPHPRDAGLESRGDNWFLRCGDSEISLARVGNDEREVLLAASRFHPRRFQRVPYALARNDDGEYFYIDRQMGARGREGFQLYRGRAGKAGLQKLKWVVSDSEGDLFATRRGKLRVSRDKAGTMAISWLAKGAKRKPIALTVVPTAQNAYLIYKQLGVYENRSLGTPCEQPGKSQLSSSP